jgi:hypothetical protein
VEDVAEEIDIGSYDRLLVEEVVRGERYPLIVRFGNLTQHFGSAHGRQVLHDEFQFRVVLGDGERYVALGSTELV